MRVTAKDLVPRVIAVHVIGRDDEREVRSVDLRPIRLHDAIESAWVRVSRRPVHVRADSVDAREAFVDDAANDVSMTLRGLRGRARKRKLTDSSFEEVADVYRNNRTSGQPTKAVRQHFGVAESTASMSVELARKSGMDMGDQHGDRQGQQREE